MPTELMADLQQHTDAIWHAVFTLPIATLLGTALALRPRRRGTPPRSSPVIQTQIILAVGGAARQGGIRAAALQRPIRDPQRRREGARVRNGAAMGDPHRSRVERHSQAGAGGGEGSHLGRKKEEMRDETGGTETSRTRMG